ncbi:GNAT family N-acetyltransferase [Brevibacillus humidisoli]|uniref:GNAT family N-acetyltransferase n=1 Tax=Brevibacillus humidisoli TaxID=2895522 RepID=UPI001E5DD3B4|nr:GNAT family N-acetyltransferase [Brevibacillus humidisoli]UFJ42529.1 GNAT family N-acetyltransferase [Brevibacillus humidisoli]
MVIREATMEDAQLLFDWRNDPVTRANSFHSEPLGWETHVAWLQQAVSRDDLHIFVVEDQEQPIGTFRLNRIDSGRAEISITVAPPCRGKGFGGQILTEAARVARDQLGYTCLQAHVKESNIASRKAFFRAGYTIASYVLELELK